jgi:hypothetical protein
MTAVEFKEYNSDEKEIKSCILITSHLNNDKKIQVAIDLLNFLKENMNLSIVFVGNHSITKEVQEKTDYTLFENKNPFTITGRLLCFGGKCNPDHGYAHLSQILTGFKFCRGLGYEYIYHFNYDVVIEKLELDRLIEMSKSENFLYSRWGNNGISSAFFSIKTNELIEALEPNLHYYYNENPPGITPDWFCETFFKWSFLKSGLYKSLEDFCDIKHQLLVSTN